MPSSFRHHVELVRTILLFFAMQALATAGWGMEPPRPGEVEQLAREGKLAEREEFGRKLGNYKISPDLARRKIAQLKTQAKGEKVGLEKFPYATGLPSKGSPRTFALLIDFSDYPHHNDPTVFSERLFGAGLDSDQPYEGLTNYYKRASYGLLTIQGDVMPWYRAKNKRQSYTDSGTLIKEALENFKNQYDFTKYDNNGDGKIDFFMVFWTGPDTGWNTFWWAWCGGFGSDFTYTVDGKRLGTFSWQWESNPPGGEFHPRVVIHETGHGLGLPDLYDYDDKVGPAGGVGGMDMMDGNWGDHNAFSKWLLDWLTPTVVSSANQLTGMSLRPSALYPDCVAIMPGISAADPFREFYMVQNRTRREKTISNDADLPGDGLSIWHIDAELNAKGDGYAYDNSYTDHKLVRLMEADGRESINAGYSADAGDLYTASTFFSPVSTPNSANYNTMRTGVTVMNIFPVTFGYPLTPPQGTLHSEFLISSSNMLGLGKALDNSAITWTTGGSAGSTWYGQAGYSFYGGSSARNIAIGDSKYATLAATVSGPSTLRFYWSTSSEANHDFLEFFIDGVSQGKISGETLWQQKSFPIAAGSHYITWKYSKDTAGASGADCGYVDKVECGTFSLAEALDNGVLNLQPDVNFSWYGQGNDWYYGGSAARSAEVPNGATSQFRAVNITGPQTLSFYWKVSSQTNSDYLEVLLDNVSQAKISGEMDWNHRTVSIPTGTHTVTWRYAKDGSGAAGADCGWVDKIISSDGNLAAGLDNYILPWKTYGDGTWVYTTSYSRDGQDSVLCQSVPQSKNGYLETSVVGPGTLNFRWFENKAASGGELDLLIDGKYQKEIYNTDWTQVSLPVSAGIHTITWRYYQLGSTPDYCGVDWVEFIPEYLTLGQALDNPGLGWETYGNTSGWIPQQNYYTYAYGAAQSGVTPHGYGSYMETVVYGPGLLSFDWRVSSEQDKDYLEFYLDDRMREHISGQTAWINRRYLISKGPHRIMWAYYKDDAGQAGKDCGWVDHVTVDPAPPLGEALDNAALSWSTGGSQDWMGQKLAWQYGGSSARSGAIRQGQTSDLSTQVTGPGFLEFYWKTSTNTFNNLDFYLDGAPRGRISGMSDWAKKTVYIDTGVHNVKWIYSEKTVFIDGEDCAWIDKATFTASGRTPVGADWALYE